MPRVWYSKSRNAWFMAFAVKCWNRYLLPIIVKHWNRYSCPRIGQWLALNYLCCFNYSRSTLSKCKLGKLFILDDSISTNKSIQNSWSSSLERFLIRNWSCLKSLSLGKWFNIKLYWFKCWIVIYISSLFLSIRVFDFKLDKSTISKTFS